MTLVVQGRGKPLPVENKDGKVTIKGTGDADRITVSEKGGTLHVALFGKTAHGGFETRTADIDIASLQSLTIDAKGGNDRIKIDDSVSGRGNYLLILKGGKGNDDIQGGKRGEKIYGGKGNDHILGGGGDDFVDGGKGNDRLVGGTGKDRIYDRNGKNRILTDEDDVLAIRSRLDNVIDGRPALIGDDASIREMKNRIASRFGVVPVDGKERIWSLDELQTLQSTLRDLPPPLQAAARGVLLRREVMDDEGPARHLGDFSRSGRIRIFDNADGELKAVVIHEIAHAYDWKDGRYSKNGFWDLSGWRKDGKEYRYDRSKDNFARSYGQTNPEEDWATSVEMFYADPDRLRRNAPDKFDYLSKLFGPPS